MRRRVWQDAFDRSRLASLVPSHGNAVDRGRADPTLAPSPRRVSIAHGPSLVVVARAMPVLPAPDESVLHLPYDESLDVDGAELARIARLVPTLARTGFGRYLRDVGRAPAALCALLSSEIVGSPIEGEDAQATAFGSPERDETAPVPGPTIVVVEAERARVDACVARDPDLRELLALGWIAIAVARPDGIAPWTEGGAR